MFSVNQIICRWLKKLLFYGKSRHISYCPHHINEAQKHCDTCIYVFIFCLALFFFLSKTDILTIYIYIVICSNVLCVLNVCKPQEYPRLLRAYANRKIYLIKKNNIHEISVSSFI